MSTEVILERAIRLAEDGVLCPLLILSHIGQELAGLNHGPALRAAMNVAGGSLVRWYGPGGLRTREETVGLLREALFQVQLGG